MKFFAVFVILIALCSFTKGQDPYCDSCEIIANWAELAIQFGGYTNATEIDDYMLALCSTLPSPLPTACDLVVKQYLEPIVDEIVKGTPASQICTNLGVCTSININFSKHKNSKHLKLKSKNF